MELECKELHRAASQQNLLTITSMMNWVGDFVGHDMSAGLFDITHPWTKIPARTSANRLSFPELKPWMAPNSPAVARWSPIAAYVRSPGSPTESSLFYGGPVRTIASNTTRQARKFVFFMLRGSSLSDFFSTLKILSDGVAILVDAKRGVCCREYQ